jgi:hypothetical protein
MSAGEQFVKWLRPAGCVLVLAVAVLVTVICLTSGRDPIPGYEAPQDTTYYAQHLDELQDELEENVFPQLEGVQDCRIEGDKLAVTVAGHTFAKTRAAILRYYDLSLFAFISE